MAFPDRRQEEQADRERAQGRSGWETEASIQVLSQSGCGAIRQLGDRCDRPLDLVV